MRSKNGPSHSDFLVYFLEIKIKSALWQSGVVFVNLKLDPKIIWKWEMYESLSIKRREKKGLNDFRKVIRSN